jgi:hypothetical protein
MHEGPFSYQSLFIRQFKISAENTNNFNYMTANQKNVTYHHWLILTSDKNLF